MATFGGSIIPLGYTVTVLTVPLISRSKLHRHVLLLEFHYHTQSLVLQKGSLFNQVCPRISREAINSQLGAHLDGSISQCPNALTHPLRGDYGSAINDSIGCGYYLSTLIVALLGNVLHQSVMEE